MSEVFLKVLNMSISASWLVLVVLLLRLVLKKAPKWVSVLLWGIVAIRLICPFCIESILSLIPSTETVSPEIMMDWTPKVSTGFASVDTVINPIITQTFAPEPTASVNPLQIWIPVVSIVWLSGIAVMLVYTAVSYILLRRRVTTAVLLKKNIFQSENVDSPFVLGIIRPKIYLPFRMDEQCLEYVIAHEMSHIRRKDHWWKPFGFLLLALHWFNPLMWLGYILLCRDIELACDERVIKEMDNENRANYTEALVACSIHRRRVAACPLAFGEVGVKERVKSVMNYKKPAFWIVVAAIISCIVVAVCFLTNPKTPQNDTPSLIPDIQGPNASQFIATVLEVHDTYLLVAPEPGSVAASSADKIEVSLKNLESRPNLEVGYTVLIVYDGYIQETYPARITNVYRVENTYFDSGPVETIYGNVKTYFRNTNGTWQTGGRNYKYRLVLTGRVPNAAQDTTFVYLSNLEHITFEQAYKAAGFSSNCADWFLVEDAVLVEWTDVTPGGSILTNLSLDPALDTAIANAILEKHQDTVPDGYLVTESYILVSLEHVRLGDAYDRNGIFTHIYYLHQLFDVSNNYPVEHTGIFQEAAIIFEMDGEGNYIEKRFFRPQYSAEYIEELAPYLIPGNKAIVENEQQYAAELLKNCWASAAAYIDDRNAGTYNPPAPINQIFDNRLSWAGFDGSAVLFVKALNRNQMQTSHTQYLPTFVFQSKDQLDNFISDTCKNLAINQSLDEVPAFTETAASYDEKFFEENSLILVYVTSENRSSRYSATGFHCDGTSFTLKVGETAKLDNGNSERGGWFVTVVVSNRLIDGCSQFTAYLG